MRIVQDMRLLAQSVARLVLQPLHLAFLPAIILGGVWFGPAGALAVAAIALPVVAVATAGGTDRSAALRDPLTGLEGEADLLSILSKDLARTDRHAHPSGLFVIDIVNLAEISARHGQEAADTALVTVSQRICAAIREADRCARLSDGKLAVLARRPKNLSTAGALTMGNRLMDAVQATSIPWGSGALTVDLAIGAVLDSQCVKPSADGLLASAHLALAETAHDAAGKVQVYSEDMKQSLDTRRDLAAELRHAFEDGQIEPWYQPQVCAHSGRVTGFEALARWQHPDRGVIPPMEFLSAIETAGLMARLGDTMLFHALAALRAWDRAGLVVDTVGVNFSSTELRDPKLVDRVRWELDRFDILPERLCVEILETVVAGDASDVICRNVEALSKMGCRIDLDDFGTGHASITNIRRFAVTRLKIDRSFVTGIERDAEQRKLAGAILSMAQQLELQTLAEGVETPGAQEVLTSMGCDFVQGFGIGRPMPFEDTIGWIKAHLRGSNTVQELRVREPQGG